MPIIKPLSERVIAAIAAGEIAERPSVIVKELVENALDAGATEVTLTLNNSGLDRIIITDNGRGMDGEDLALAIQRHTTSKITSVDDLEKVSTLGFRGEALASIGSVATLTIQSKTPTAQSGWQIVVDNGQVAEVEPMGMRDGTTVIVEHLFASIPARRKFLKQPATELRHILDVITALSLAHPAIGFEVINNQKNLLQLASDQTLIERVKSLMGENFSEFLLPITFQETYFEISGFLGNPQLARRTNQHQFLFVNQRFVTHPPLNRLVKNAYGSLIEPKAEPVFFMFLKLPQPLVDINVHPRKEAIKFVDENQLFGVIKTAVSETLGTHDLTYEYGQSSGSLLRDRRASPTTSNLLKRAVTTWQLGQSPSDEVVQIHNTYLLTQTSEGMVIVDQHAAHERILYEQFLAEFQNQQSQHQSVDIKPITIELSLVEAHLLTEHLETLRSIGFGIDEFGGTTFKVSALPQLLADRQPQKLITELLDEIHLGRELSELDSLSQRTLAFLACRHAVKAGDVLSPDQRKELLIKLSQTSSNFTCPHGRPVSVTFKLADFEKIFKRSGF